MQTTHKFKLLSGPECEVKEMGGPHQEILTRGGIANFDKKLVTCLQDLIVRIGTETNITEELIAKLLTTDRKKILFEIRQFSLDFDPVFKFKYKYLSEAGGKGETELEIDLSKGVAETPFYKQWNEYNEVDKHVYCTLPRSGVQIRYTMLDSLGEAQGLAIAKKDRSSNTPLVMRNVCEMHTKEGGGTPTPIRSNLTYGLKDMEFLRTHIKEHEGRIDTEVMFEHPEKEGEDVIIDMVSQLAFFFPSEAL